MAVKWVLITKSVFASVAAPSGLGSSGSICHCWRDLSGHEQRRLLQVVAPDPPCRFVSVREIHPNQKNNIWDHLISLLQWDLFRLVQSLASISTFSPTFLFPHCFFSFLSRGGGLLCRQRLSLQGLPRRHPNLRGSVERQARATRWPCPQLSSLEKTFLRYPSSFSLPASKLYRVEFNGRAKLWFVCNMFPCKKIVSTVIICMWFVSEVPH
jgi:hypothetical protein